MPARPALFAALLALTALVAACGEAPRRPHVILVSVDTLRADHLGCYGYERDTSPWLDGLAARGVVFEQAHAQATATLTSHASLLTSLYPPQLALTRNDGTNTNQHLTALRLADDVQTLAEALSAAGYATAAFTGGAMTAGHYGLDHGFELYREATGGDDADVRVRLEQLRGYLDERAAAQDERPLFLFVHSYDVHDPYAAPGRFARRFTHSSGVEWARREGYGPTAQGLRVAMPEPSESQLREVVGLYDNGIAYMDHRLSQLEQLLRERGLWDEALVVVLSDHGEEFLEHGSWGHGPTVHGELTHVPLVLRLPGDAQAGARVAQPVELVDVAPTALEVAGLDAPPDWRGRSLLPLARGEVVDSKLVYSDIPNAELGRRAVRQGRWKLVVHDDDGSRRLYDVRADPDEQHDLAAEHPEVVAELTAAFGDWQTRNLRGGDELRAVLMDDPSKTLDATYLEMLRQLGYVR